MGAVAAVIGEGQLVQRVKAGDSSAFAPLFERYQIPICTYLYRLVGNREEAYDLTQETFLKAFQALSATGPDLHLSAWLYRIATNTALSSLRRRRLIRWLPLLDWEEGPRDSSREGLPELVAEAEAIQQILRRLPRDYAVCLLLHDQEGLSAAEVGEVMRLSPGAVRVKLFRARKRFRELYQGDKPSAERGAE